MVSHWHRRGLGFCFVLWLLDHELRRGAARNGLGFHFCGTHDTDYWCFPKMFIPFLVVIPGMVASVSVADLMEERAEPNDAILLLMRDLLPNGLLGVAIAGLLASFMAGMAANISAFNTVISYDIWQTYVVKDREDGYYLKFGRVATVGLPRLPSSRRCWRRTLAISWITCKRSSDFSTRRFSPPSSWACFGSE